MLFRSCPGDWILQNGSQSGVQYTLYRDGLSTGIIKNGPGPLDFGPQTLPGTYTVLATTNGSNCSVWINGSVVIDPLITPANAGTITGTPHVCRGAQNIPFSIGPIAGATSYLWVMPSGATIISGQGTNQISTGFSPGFSGGNILALGMNSCASGQHSSLWITGHSLTGYISLTGATIQSGDSLCYAYEEIWMGDNVNPYNIQSGGSLILRSMKAIHLLPGTIAEAGSYLHVSVTTCLPCNQNKLTRMEPGSEPETLPDENQEPNSSKPEMVIFPNPADRLVFVMLSGVPEGEEIRIEAIDMFGRKLYTETLVNKMIMRLPLTEAAPGICIIRCITSSAGVLSGKIGRASCRERV